MLKERCVINIIFFFALDVLHNTHPFSYFSLSLFPLFAFYFLTPTFSPSYFALFFISPHHLALFFLAVLLNSSTPSPLITPPSPHPSLHFIKHINSEVCGDKCATVFVPRISPSDWNPLSLLI